MPTPGLRTLFLGFFLSVLVSTSPARADPGTVLGLSMMAGAAGVVVGSMSGQTYSVWDEVHGLPQSPRADRRNRFDVAYPVYQPTVFVPANTPPAAVYSSVPPHRPHAEDLYSSQMMVYVPHYRR